MERTVLEFPRGITGIVGPNGCGKSNIVDALRWVLGEQSAKHLRGQTMEDVICSGNERFGPLGLAEVVITFDNDGSLEHLDAERVDDEPDIAAALKDAPEIEVTRRLYRSGESEYQINGRTCRLRDITELFLGTGVGTKAYSIIEQGRVGQIVGAKPEELRLFIEEAAGTTLYRSRKLAAERKIERTHNNLLRVSDIVQELERQSASLKRQVRGAVRYKELKAKEAELDGRLTTHRLHTVASRAREASVELEAIVASDDALRVKMGDATSRRDALRDEEALKEREAETAQRAFYESKAKLSQLDQERRHLTDRIEELDGACQQGQAELTEVEARLAAISNEEQSVVAEAQEHRRELDGVAQRREEAEGLAAGVESRLSTLGAELEETKGALFGALNARASLSNERASNERSRQELKARKQRLHDEAGSLDTVVTRLEADLVASQSKVDGLGRELEAASVGKESSAEKLGAIVKAKAESEQLLEKARADVAGLDSGLKSLRELNEGFVGYGEGVRAFMSNGGIERTGAVGVVADVLEIESGYERAVAAVLQERLQYVIVPTSDAGMVGAAYLRETGAGRASFIPVSPRRTQRGADAIPSGFSALSSHVRAKTGYQDTVAELMDGVVLADSLEHATDQWRRGGEQYTFVTKDGEILDASGVVTGGSGRPIDEGILVRRAELRGLEAELLTARAQAERAAHEFSTVGDRARDLGEEVAGLDQRVHELTVAKVAAEGECELQRQNLARTVERRETVTSEIRGYDREMSELGDRDRELSRELEEAASEIRHRELLLERGGEERNGLETDRRSRSAALEELRVGEAETRQKRESCEMRLAAVRQSSADFTSRRGSLAGRLERDRRDLEAARERLSGPELSVDGAREALRACEASYNAAHAQVEAAKRELATIQSTLDETGAEIEVVRDKRGRVELKLKECELERQSIEESARERMGEAVDKLLTGTAEVEVEEDAAALEAEIERTRTSLRRLGLVNVGAVSELEELEGRLVELTSQRNDLDQSIESLRGTISRLNRLSRQRFKQTFDSVNAIFEKTFPKLFQGGRAWLTLTDEANLLETGVEIFVQPPGKKLGNLNLLSGGEKALTAVSLIFSLFLHKPSPFCVLDEVDAPLDDANIGRFAGMVADMCTRSQFVIITHNKRTMECCDMLYGVTMREPGVSKIVSVEMTRSIELEQAAPARSDSEVETPSSEQPTVPTSLPA
jgi:chromosome segregation protein